MGSLLIKNVSKVYPNKVRAVTDFNAEIKDGEFIVIVGPSGCGKSTLLRMIVGLEETTSGEMYLDGVLINNLAPGDRDIAMVFQNYALYQTMSVYNNIGISLKLKHNDPYDIHEGVMGAAESLDLIEYLNRSPRQLSGGQRQRVALG
ncbi:MAG: ATP-binding cassette domain-containing protein, partial [Bacilli bacterium]|nr:ATP-binding cassette domain-containing protein [Bacilli bacterium]